MGLANVSLNSLPPPWILQDFLSDRPEYYVGHCVMWLRAYFSLKLSKGFPRSFWYLLSISGASVKVSKGLRCHDESHNPSFVRGQKINANFFCTRFFKNASGHGRPRRKSWTSAPKSAFSCGPGGGEKLFDPWAFGRKGQECPRKIRAKKFMFMLFFLP